MKNHSRPPRPRRDHDAPQARVRTEPLPHVLFFGHLAHALDLTIHDHRRGDKPSHDQHDERAQAAEEGGVTDPGEARLAARPVDEVQVGFDPRRARAGRRRIPRHLFRGQRMSEPNDRQRSTPEKN